MITTYEQEGIKKGRREGIKEGIQKGRQKALLLLLERRFGQLPDAVKRKVRRIQSVERLDSLLLAVLDAKSLDDLFL